MDNHEGCPYKFFFFFTTFPELSYAMLNSHSIPFAKNNHLWIQKGLNSEKPLTTEKGVGLDMGRR